MSRNGLRGWLRAFFQRDRLTGQIAVGLVGVLGVSAVVYGVGIASSRYDLSDVGSWLSAQRKGLLVHANGPSGQVDGKTALPKTMRGHRIKIVQDGRNVLIVDLDTGVVGRLDASQFTVDKSRTLGGPELQVVTGAGKAFTVDSAKGTVQQIDPITLAAVGQAATLTPILDQARVDSQGALWVPVPRKGQIASFKDGVQRPPTQVGQPGQRLALTMSAGEPVAIDPAAATATVIRPSGDPLKISLPSTVRQADPADVLVPPHAEGRTVPVLVPGSLLLLDADTGRSVSKALRGARGRYGAPQILGARVYIPDTAAGALLVYDTITKNFRQHIPVTGHRSPLDVFVKDGMLWAHDPNGDRAVVLDRQGNHKNVEKYKDSVPGGRRLPLPAPNGNGGDRGDSPGRGGDRGGDRPGRNPQRPPAPTTPGPTHTPRPDEPPLPPGAPTVSSGDGTVQVDFEPGVGGKPTGYVLKDLQAGMTASPTSIAPGAATNAFTVSGGQCSREYQFRVAVQYKDAQGRTAEKVSPLSSPVRPCVPPAAPRNPTATASTGGAKVSWTAAQNASTGTRYKLSWTGPVSGTKEVDGTSVTLSNVATNGKYTFTVSAANEAGAGNSTSTSPQLTGPVTSYAVQHNGNSNAYIHSGTNANNSGDVVATMNDNNGTKVPVECQVRGTRYKHSNGDPNFAGDMYPRIRYGGKTGYIIGYLIKTPGSWKSFQAPKIWKCR